MTIFPSVTPTSRSWSPGAIAQTSFSSIGGYEIRFLHADRAFGQRLSLGFVNVTNAVGKSITDHYITVMTTFESFDVPAEVYAGMATYAHMLPTGNAWRYVGPPSVIYGVPGYQSLSVELIGVAA